MTESRLKHNSSLHRVLGCRTCLKIVVPGCLHGYHLNLGRKKVAALTEGERRYREFLKIYASDWQKVLCSQAAFRSS